MSRKDLTRDEWRRADALARELARDVDRNEFGKIVTYMRRERNPQKVRVLLGRLPHSSFIRSNQTQGYLERIGDAWERHLQGLPRERAVLVASWAFRLMTYYQA
ncbi:MAG: hypothetical protein IAE79_13760 [Anaerolinea sp.]|nr:hypothetical protein [Anaerolinea sp.]